MRENDVIKGLKDIEKRSDVEIHDLKSPLVLFNLNSSKYVAALRAANVLSTSGIDDSSWKLFEEIVTDTESFLADPTEVDFMQDVFLEVLYNNIKDIDITMNDEVLNVSDDEYERFYEYVVSRDEIELFKNIYIDFICAAISVYKKGKLEFNVSLKLSNRWISAVYKNDKNLGEKLEHFKKSFYAFWIYNGFHNIRMYIKKSFFGYTYINFEIEKTV